MSEFLNALRTSPLLADGAIGTYLFERTGRISEMNHVYEALNVDNPELIRNVHSAYLQAGARCLTTNTFGANLAHLAPFGESERVDELNRAGVRLAREAIAAFRDESQTEGSYFVMGSLGPTPAGDESPREIKEIYGDQVAALVSERVDALLLETYSSLAQVMAVMEQVREFAAATPLIVQMALDRSEGGSGWSQDPAEFVQTAADMGAQVVGVNCCAPWDAASFVDAVKDMDVVKRGRAILSAMPNAGGFQRIGHRYMTRVNPEYMGKLARTLSEQGVRLVGGCCEVHPPHINEMHNYLHGRLARGSGIGIASKTARAPAGDDLKKANGAFSRKIKEGGFAVSVEMLPSRGTAPRTLQDKVDFVAALAAAGLADALDVADGSRGIPLMPPGDFITVVRERLDWSSKAGDGIEFIPHFTARDMNVMGLQSRLIGYYAQRINNVVFITGDAPKMSPTYPRATAVFDLDSVAMIGYAHSCLNAGVDIGGQPLGRHSDPRTHFTIGSGFEPEALDPKRELDKLRQKIDNGVDYIMTQPAFRIGPLDTLDALRSEVPILVGTLVLTSLEHARRVAEIPGVVVPETVYERLSAYSNVRDQARAGVEFAVEQVRWIKEQGWAGLYLMSPSSHRPTFEVLRGAFS